LNLTNVLIIAFVCVTIGYIAGLLVSNMRSEPKPAPQLPEAADKPGGPYLEVAQLVREEGSGPLLIHMENKYYRSPGELNPAQRLQMEEVTLELHNWLGYPLAPVRTAPAAVPAAVSLAPTPLAVAVPAAAVPAAAVSAAAEPVPAISSQAGHSQAAPASIPAPIAPAPKAPAPKAPVKSIVMQINDILQDNIAGTDNEKRGIRLIELPNRGVAVQVGLERFQDIDSVPEPEVRSLIRAAVSEWELKAK
jgi:hypothetical protein